MSILKNFYKKLTCTDWQVVFADNNLDGIVSGNSLTLNLMQHPYKDRWFADPFILDVTTDEILLLAECVTDDTRRGRIALLNVNKETYTLKSMKFVLDLTTHLSFPVIVRSGEDVYVYPENGESGALNLYKLDKKNQELVFDRKIIEKPLGDAIITRIFGSEYMFATEEPDMNGNILSVFSKTNNGQWELSETVEFADKVARNAGEFFKIGNNVYRPAQECNEDYGHGIVIQEVSKDGDGWSFKEIRRMTSPLKRYPMCLHTLNTYKNVTVMDVKGFRYGLLGSLLFGLKTMISRKK